MGKRLVFRVPGREEPGFLLRAKQALEFREKLGRDLTVEGLTAMVEFLAQFVAEPEEPKAKLEALWMASQAEFEELLTVVAGGDHRENPT